MTKKQFKIYKFDESTYCYKNIVSVKVSKKAEKLALKSQRLFMEHDAVIDALFIELSKDNPNIDFSDFIGDDFAMFTGQVLN